GILVDDSIVVNDNIQRRYKLGDSALNGAVNGVKEVYTSIISSSLAIVVTFSPLLLLSGGNGAFIKALPSILITTIISSTILSVTLVPMLQFIKTKRRNKKNIRYTWFSWKTFRKNCRILFRNDFKKSIKTSYYC